MGELGALGAENTMRALMAYRFRSALGAAGVELETMPRQRLLGASIESTGFDEGGPVGIRLLPIPVAYNPITGGSGGGGTSSTGGFSADETREMIREFGIELYKKYGFPSFTSTIFTPPLIQGNCSDKLHSDCPEPSDLTIRSVTDFQAINSSDWEGKVEIDSEFTDEEEEFLLTAWALINENIDLVKYAVCIVTDSENAVDCFVDHIQDEDFRIRYVDCHHVVAYALPGRSIYVCAHSQSDFHNDFLDVWKCADSGSVERMCAALELACMFVHELTHTCGRAMGDWISLFGINDCDDSYLITNVFRWFLYQRYAGTGNGDGVRDSDCCEDLAYEGSFGSDDNVYLKDNGCNDCPSSSPRHGPYDPPVIRI